MRRVWGQEFREALRTVHVRGVQELLQEIRQTEPDVHVSREPELPHRPTPPQPVPVLSLQEVSEGRDEARRYVLM